MQHGRPLRLRAQLKRPTIQFQDLRTPAEPVQLQWLRPVSGWTPHPAGAEQQHRDRSIRQAVAWPERFAPFWGVARVRSRQALQTMTLETETMFDRSPAAADESTSSRHVHQRCIDNVQLHPVGCLRQPHPPPTNRPHSFGRPIITRLVLKPTAILSMEDKIEALLSPVRGSKPSDFPSSSTLSIFSAECSHTLGCGTSAQTLFRLGIH